MRFFGLLECAFTDFFKNFFFFQREQRQIMLASKVKNSVGSVAHGIRYGRENT